MKRLNMKDLLFLGNTLTKYIHASRDTKEYYQLFIIKKNRKLVKQSEIITYQPKTFDIFYVK